ncbi:hypothetical protein JI747_011425 [Chryseobacterium sp. RG1]|uniref:C1q domain-containing protein n=1 Tax=Chryseobacterium tagetis TaxID=2801334 RepID=A0ABS8A1C4_9FLAO|nr:hypothetical protein [Chryseobacterium tagetis]MCA6067792.1 hypothetical protein [Chryseobacterium tagetis]
MKSFITLIVLIFLSTITKAQVGIMTTKPLQPLHIDASGNNNNADPVTDAQKNDDFTITKNGSVGIGDITPDRKLVVKGSIKITDGSQGVGKILSSDANGVATWNGNVNTAGKYAQWELRQTTGMNFPASDTLTLGATDPSQATLNSVINFDQGVGLTPTTYGVHIPKGKYFVVVNGDVQGREYCYLFVHLDGHEVARVAYAEYLSGVTFLLDVKNNNGGDITLKWINRPLSGISYYQLPQNRTYFYTLDINLLGNLIF